MVTNTSYVRRFDVLLNISDTYLFCHQPFKLASQQFGHYLPLTPNTDGT